MPIQNLSAAIRHQVHAKADLPTDAHGRLYHLGLQRGQVSNLIITVGDELRARSIALMFDNATLKDNVATDVLPQIRNVFSHHSSRGFLTFTGKYKGRPISVISIGMGSPMMDFMVREVRTIVDGPLIIIRVGTCGVLGCGMAEEYIARDWRGIGMLAVADSSIVVQRNYHYEFKRPPSKTEFDCKEQPAYHLSPIFSADNNLSQLLKIEAQKQLGIDQVLWCMNASADSFYGSQGRETEHFHDHNDHLLDTFRKLGVQTLEMETGHLLHLAHCNTGINGNEIRAAAIHVVVADRSSGKFLVDADQRLFLDRHAARAALDVLASVEIGEKWLEQAYVHL